MAVKTIRKASPRVVYRRGNDVLFWQVEPHARTLFQSDYDVYGDYYVTSSRRMRIPRAVVGIAYGSFSFCLTHGNVRDENHRVLYDSCNLGNGSSYGAFCLGDGLRQKFGSIEERLLDRLDVFYSRPFNFLPEQIEGNRGPRISIRDLCFIYAPNDAKHRHRETRYVKVAKNWRDAMFRNEDYLLDAKSRLFKRMPKRDGKHVILAVSPHVEKKEAFTKPLSSLYYNLAPV